MPDTPEFFDALDALPPLRDVIAANNLNPQKKFGQNFLLDLNVTDKIVQSSGDIRNKTIIEIGPGPGGLTRSLLRAGAGRVIAVEFDPRAVAALSSLVNCADGRLQIVHGDALELGMAEFCAAHDITADDQPMIFGNLPYNIATPLLVSWLRTIDHHPALLHGMTLMFQKEVGDRIQADLGSKQYGRLSVMTQWLCDVCRLFDLPPSVFMPPPKVTSSVLHFSPKTGIGAASAADVDFDRMEAIVAAAFGQRRKMIRQSLKSYGDLIQRADIKETLRAEQLTVENFCQLARLS